MKDKEKVYDIAERAFNFAVRIVKVCQYLEKNTDVSRTVIGQLLDAGTSVGANLEEAEAGQSKRRANLPIGYALSTLHTSSTLRSRAALRNSPTRQCKSQI